MKTITLGRTGITTPQNAFGALPIQRVSKDEAVAILRRAFDGGMTFFDTAIPRAQQYTLTFVCGHEQYTLPVALH